jgi:hypothetical protein
MQTGKVIGELKHMRDARSREIIRVANASNRFVQVVDWHKSNQLQAPLETCVDKSAQDIEDAKDDMLAMEEMVKICQATADLTMKLKEEWDEWSAGQQTTTVTSGSNTVNNGLSIGNSAG